ncbi:dipeptidase [Mycolicibacterium litorale]|uniref:Dipeptidase n=1 Tax=Mycolicibacterium litorale TaxID=758802 RepID=A0A6S6P949_9MYCO|nr:C69 family dipeptidase [Mycolicibacterium litorale]BCI55194.1 dipeptidase [Mycolicibacterium litorale]
MYSDIRAASCDTMVAVGDATASGRTILAKNSDRNPNEAQYLYRAPAATHEPGAVVRATYISIPQVPSTHGVIGSRPWWIWGFEHGVNEHGVGVGNEALWSREEASAEPGLLGMDLLRLVLERAATADEGLQVLIGLLEEHGQSGTTNLVVDQTYHNGFLIADPSTAWVIETANKHWAAKRVTTVATISNAYSIGSDYDLISADAESYAVERGWWNPSSGGRFDFGAAYADPELPFLASCTARLARSGRVMQDNAERGKVAIEDMWAVLRDIGDTAADWRPGIKSESVICMHAEDTKGHETAASIVTELSADPLILASLASPRLSSFVPVWFDSTTLPWQQPDSAGTDDAWWATEDMQRLVERDYAALGPAPEALFNQADIRTLAAVRALGASASTAERDAVTAEALERRSRIVAHCRAMVAELGDVLADPATVDPRGTYLADIEALRAPTHRGAIPAHLAWAHEALADATS